MRYEYTVTEYNLDDDQVHHEHGHLEDHELLIDPVDADAVDGRPRTEIEAVALSLVLDWVPIDPMTETWRARVRGADGTEAEAFGPANTVRLIDRTPLPDPRQLVAQMEPLTRQLRRVAEQVPPGDEPPALYQLLPLVADLVAGVQYCFNTVPADPRDTGRHNLDAVQSRARHLAATAAQAAAEARRR